MTEVVWGGLLEGMLEAVWVVDPRSLRIVALNQVACTLVGMAREDILGKPAIDFTATPEDMFFWEDVAAGLADCIHSSTLLRCADGVAIPVVRRVSRVRLGDDEPVYVVGLHDLRPQQQAEQELEHRLAELRATLESTGDGILVTDLFGRVRNYNHSFVSLWDVPEAVLESPGDQPLFAHMAGCMQNPRGYLQRLQEIHSDPTMEVRDVLVLQSGRLIERYTQPQTSQGRTLGRVFAFSDVTERHEAQKRIETLAYTDVLTGLPNRLLLGQRADLALRMAQRHGGSCAVLFVDLDRFKNINDSLGHSLGDRVLIEVAGRIQHCLREIDTLCRLGGDEFVVFLQEADALGAEVAARRILEALAQPFDMDGVNFTMGGSIGVAMYPEDGKTLDVLIQCADTAMYRVKERGRGNFRFYQPQMNVDLLSRMKMDHAMRMGLEHGLFSLHYQPQVSLADGGLLGAEALVRWTDPDLGHVPPTTFIPLAEDTGFIIAIGNWVLSEAVRQAAVWQASGKPVVVSVNVSALQFQQPDFVERVANTIRQAGLEPALIELELTESILIRDANEALARLHALADHGVSLAIDDFGTGYSSLAYLKKFPISKLKIDRAFVMGLPEDESDRAIVGATIAMARALKMTVVAEGVESEAQRDYLQGLRCESFQGFLCSPGVPPAQFETLAASLPRGTAGSLL